jgi:hypothetical protein
MEETKEKRFADFSGKVQEICQHYDQVEDMKFTANLKNGTTFRFKFDAEEYDKAKEEKRPYKPVSVFNSIIDMIGAGLSIAGIVVLHGNLIALLASSFLFCVFAFSAIGHLLDEGRTRSRLVFANLEEAFKVIFLCLYNGMFASSTQYHFSALVTVTLLLGALSLLLLSIQTKGAGTASKLVSAMIPCFSMLSVFSLFTLASSLLFSLWSLLSVVLGERKAAGNTIFAVIGMIMTILLFS